MIIYYYIYLHLCAEQLASFVAFCDVQLHCTSGMLSSWQNESFLLYTDTQSCLVVVVVLADVECVCTWPCVSNHLAVADQANTRPVADVSLVVVSACAHFQCFDTVDLAPGAIWKHLSFGEQPCTTRRTSSKEGSLCWNSNPSVPFNNTLTDHLTPTRREQWCCKKFPVCCKVCKLLIH